MILRCCDESEMQAIPSHMVREVLVEEMSFQHGEWMRCWRINLGGKIFLKKGKM